MPRWALWLLALGCVGTLAYFAIAPPRRPRRRRANPWRTLSNRRRVFIDDDGRITKGLPLDWHGSHVRDVPELARRWRQIDRDEQECAGGGGRGRATFGSQQDGIRALLDANPELEDFIELEAKGAKESAYRTWVSGGRRGKKPELSKGDGRFDAINETLNLRGGRRVSTWKEALARTVPASRRWADFEQRIEMLEDATGLRLNLPGPAEELVDQGSTRAQCFAAGDRYRDDLVDHARRGRLAAAGDDLGDVPF